jgi:hypothetical protein
MPLEHFRGALLKTTPTASVFHVGLQSSVLLYLELNDRQPGNKICTRRNWGKISACQTKILNYRSSIKRVGRTDEGNESPWTNTNLEPVDQCNVFIAHFIPDGSGSISVPNAHNLERVLHGRSLLGPQHRNTSGSAEFVSRGLSFCFARITVG